MRHKKEMIGLVILFFLLTSLTFAEDYPLQYFLKKVSSKADTLSKKERVELLDRIKQLLEQVQEVHRKLIQSVQTGEMEIRYQEGKFWVSKLEEDRTSMDVASQQMKSLLERPTRLVPAIKLYKSLRNLSSNFNAYNNLPLFSASVGDLAPELELWTDPVFYQLYLLPLAQSKDSGARTSPGEKKPVSKVKKP